MFRSFLNPVPRAGQGFLLGILCALLTLGADQLGMLERVKGGALDAQFRARGVVYPSPDIVIVEADDSTIARYQQWPLPRRVYTQLIQRLSDAGAKTIAFDVMFPVPSGWPQEDEALVKATGVSKRVIHAAAFSFEFERDPMLSVGMPNNAGKILPRFRIPDRGFIDFPQTLSGSAPMPALQKNAWGLGHVNAPPESDGVLRRVPHILRFRSGEKPVLYPSLSLVAASHFLDIKPEQIETRQREIVVHTPGSPRHIPLDVTGTTWVNWIGPHNSFPTHSFNSILDGRVPNSEFKNKLILVGITAAGSFERHPTPFSPIQPAVELQANAIDDILMRRPLQMAPDAVLLGLLLLFPALIGAVTLSRGAKLSAVILGVAGVMLSVLPVWILSRSHIIVPVAKPFLAAFLAWSGGVGLRQFLDSTQLRLAEERYSLAVRGANDGLWDWNLKNRKIYFSPRWKAMLGYDETESNAQIGSEIDEWYRRVHPDELEAVKTQLQAHISGGTTHFESEYRMQHRDGRYIWVLSRGLRVCDEKGVPTRMAGSQTDISEQIEAKEQLERNAFFDSLTGLPNRALFMNDLSRALASAIRRNKHPFAVLSLDLDRFKTVNDSLGHAGGDALLQQVARRLESCLRPSDTAARLGGDEFTILLVEIEGLGEANRIVERIQRELALPVNIEGQEVFPSASIGIALSSASYGRAENLLRDADTAMYRAKALGRSHLAIFDEAMHAQSLSMLRLETELRHAIDREEFLIVYQPIVALSSGKLAGFEALVRWNHPERGMVSPGEFIPLAEDTGLIIPLDYLVLRAACAQMQKWRQEIPDQSLFLSVNMSSPQFAQSDVTANIQRVLIETEFPADALKLEITESVLMEDADEAALKFRGLQAIGIQLSIDDFGTGYSSLSYLHRFALNTLKIDQSFVRRIDDTGENAEIVHTIAALARNLQMNVVAEGVETPAQMTQLRAAKCDYGQGYYFARPLSASDAEALLLKNQPWIVEESLAHSPA
ncbi:MAG TPA: EAL domain-containing protein [Abditibacterium sp.]